MLRAPCREYIPSCQGPGPAAWLFRKRFDPSAVKPRCMSKMHIATRGAYLRLDEAYPSLEKLYSVERGCC